MLSKSLRIVIGAIIALLLIVAVYVMAQPHISQNQVLNPIDTTTAQADASNTETHISSDSKIITGPTVVATTQPVPTALAAQEQPQKTENTTPIKIISNRELPLAGFNFGSNNIDRYCIYKVQETNKNVTLQKHAEYWMDYIATDLEGRHNISDFEHRYNITYSNCIERLTKSINNGPKPVENAEKMLVTVQ